MSASWCAQKSDREAVADRLHHGPQARSRRPPTGIAWPSRKRVRPALAGSARRCSTASLPTRFLLTLRDNRGLGEALSEPRLERAIGVIYAPETERASHCFQARHVGPVRRGAALRRDFVRSSPRIHCRMGSGRVARNLPLCGLIDGAGDALGRRRAIRSGSRLVLGLSRRRFEPARGRPRALSCSLTAAASSPPQPAQSARWRSCSTRQSSQTLLVEPFDLGGRGGRYGRRHSCASTSGCSPGGSSVSAIGSPRTPETRQLRIGYFGASTGSGAALVAAGERAETVGAVVSRGGRPDLAGIRPLAGPRADPTDRRRQTMPGSSP